MFYASIDTNNANKNKLNESYNENENSHFIKDTNSICYFQYLDCMNNTENDNNNCLENKHNIYHSTIIKSKKKDTFVNSTNEASRTKTVKTPLLP